MHPPLIKNIYRQGREERKGALKAFLRALRDPGGEIFIVIGEPRSWRLMGE